MDTFDVRDAKTHLSRLIDRAAKGEPFIIAKAGKPIVKVVPYVEGEPVPRPRLGTLAGLIAVPDDFDEMGRGEIELMFYGGAED